MSDFLESLARIDDEILAIKNMHSYAVASSHLFITKRIQTLNEVYQPLADKLGEDKAVAVLSMGMERMAEAIEGVQEHGK